MPAGFLPEIMAHARKAGLEGVLVFDVAALRIEERIRAYCAENVCGQYGNHHMCPPRIGTLEETKARLLFYRTGLLLQKTWEGSVRRDRGGVEDAKRAFHQSILDVEEGMRSLGAGKRLGLIGGHCALCEPCKAVSGEPCPFPERARPSLESMGVDVMALLGDLGLEAAFHPDRITWTGAVLFHPRTRRAFSSVGNSV